MRACSFMPALRILRWSFLPQLNSKVVPVNVICKSTHLLMRSEISSSGCLFSSCSPVSSNFSRQSRYVAESIRVSHRDDARRVESSENISDRSTDDTDVLRQQTPHDVIKDIYDELITAPKWLTDEEWSLVGEKFDKDSFLVPLWPTLLLNFIAQKTEAVPGLYSIGISLVEYIGRLSDRHRLLRLVSAIAISVHQGGESYYEQALASYDQLCAEYDVFDPGSAFTLITALARTRYWRCCLQLFDMVKITAEPTARFYSPIIIAAMKNQDYNLANELIATLSRNDLMPGDEVFLHMIANGTVDEVLTVLKDFSWIPSRAVADFLDTHLQRYVRFILQKNYQKLKHISDSWIAHIMCYFIVYFRSCHRTKAMPSVVNYICYLAGHFRSVKSSEFSSFPALLM